MCHPAHNNLKLGHEKGASSKLATEAQTLGSSDSWLLCLCCFVACCIGAVRGDGKNLAFAATCIPLSLLPAHRQSASLGELLFGRE